MIGLIREYQLNIMLFLCGACGILVLLMLFTRFISKSRKSIILVMELTALLLLWFDRQAYLYAGDTSVEGYYMVRVSNFIVFFLTPAIALVFDLYLADLIRSNSSEKELPKRIRVVGVLSAAGMLMAVISAFTGLYYYFDETNTYHRGKFFLIAYIVPVICPIVLYTVVRQKRKLFSKYIYLSLTLYIFVPIICGILQVFMYGISLVNMAMVAVSVCMYIFTYIDINASVENAHEREIKSMQGEQKHMQILFDQTATAFVSAVEKKDDFLKGTSVRTAEYAKMIAKLSGKSDEDCEKVYYAALLHDVGMIGIPDSVIKQDTDPAKPHHEIMKQKPVIGREILSCITEYPYLSQAAYCSHERYNGTGYPEGLKGKDIPEIARIVAVADAYVTMTTKKRYRDARPDFVTRETFVKEAGGKFDPYFADIMVGIIDNNIKGKTMEEPAAAETSLSCGEYRSTISKGIEVLSAVRKIRFEAVPSQLGFGQFSSPSIVLFDSYDDRVHSDKKTIKEYHYFEYGEFWFDDHMISTGARKTSVTKVVKKTDSGGDTGYEITACKFDDHIRLEMSSPRLTREIIIALPNGSMSAYIGLTGEHCEITNITVEPTGETVGEGDIPRIAKAISYIDHIESDLKNIQINRTRSASTDGILIERSLSLIFHTMSLPGANLIWHCPYIVLFSSDDGLVNGKNYREFVLIKLNGETENMDKSPQNKFLMKKLPDFPGWETWKELNRKGMECEISLERKGNRVKVRTENLGIGIECTINAGDSEKIYAALTGDQVALTDIRVMQFK